MTERTDLKRVNETIQIEKRRYRIKRVERIISDSSGSGKKKEELVAGGVAKAAEDKAQDLSKIFLEEELTAAQKKLPPIATIVKDPDPPVPHGGSTDTADVSWVCPTVQMHIATSVVGTPGHSWQGTSQFRASYAKKAMLYAGKSVAGTILRLMENPELLRKAKEEHFEKTGGEYICPIPADLKPKLVPDTRKG